MLERAFGAELLVLSADAPFTTREEREQGLPSVLPQLRDSKPRYRSDLHQVQLSAQGCRRAEVQGHDDDEPAPPSASSRPDATWRRCPPRGKGASGSAARGSSCPRGGQAQGHDGRGWIPPPGNAWLASAGWPRLAAARTLRCTSAGGSWGARPPASAGLAGGCSRSARRARQIWWSECPSGVRRRRRGLPLRSDRRRRRWNLRHPPGGRAGRWSVRSLSTSRLGVWGVSAESGRADGHAAPIRRSTRLWCTPFADGRPLGSDELRPSLASGWIRRRGRSVRRAGAAPRALRGGESRRYG
jgi:hypothetical protein